MAVSDPREVGPARQPGDHRVGDEEPRHGGPVGARGPEAGDRLHRSRDAEGRDTGADLVQLNSMEIHFSIEMI